VLIVAAGRTSPARGVAERQRSADSGLFLFGWLCLLVADGDAGFDKLFDFVLDPAIGALANAELYWSRKLLISDQAVKVLPCESDAAITQVCQA
jgi:hypothetical protein